MKRGEVYWVTPTNTTGSEQGGNKDRTGVIIQNDIGNQHSPTVIIAYTTTKDKGISQPTHVQSSFGLILLEQLFTVSKSRIKNIAGVLSSEEIKNMNAALNISLALEPPRTINEILSERIRVAEYEISELEKRESVLADKKSILLKERENLQIILSLCDENLGKNLLVSPVKTSEELEKPVQKRKKGISQDILEYLEKHKIATVVELTQALTDPYNRSSVANALSHLGNKVVSVSRGTYSLGVEEVKG